MDQINKTRAGLNPDLSSEELSKILSVNDNNFRVFSKDRLLDEEALFYKTGFYSPKGNSISKRSDQERIKRYRQNSYHGFWRESGWIDPNRITGSRNSLLITSPVAFCDKNKLPYTVPNITTGVYIDVKWSGYQEEYDNNKYCIAGLIWKQHQENKLSRPEDFAAPYRNYFEIFEHSGFQKQDIHNHKFFLESGYIEGQPIGYNKIYYQSGLDPSGFLDYKFLYIPNERLTDYDERLAVAWKPYVASSEMLNEPHNVVRYNIFFYTGELPIVYLTGASNIVKRGFGFGPVYQHNNPKYKLFVNNNYKIDFTGVYGEYTTKEFSVFNTGNILENFYIGIDRPDLISIDHSIVPGKSNFGVWSNEGQTNKSYGEMIDKVYRISRDSNINFKVSINTRGITPNTKNLTYVNIYRITGSGQAFSSDFPSEVVNIKYSSQKYSLPVYITALTNNSTIISDDTFYQNLPSGDFKPIFKAGQSINIDPEDEKNNFNISKQIGLSLYTIGENQRDLRVKLDAMSKVKRKGIQED